jgi:outer membrane usher protein
MRICAPQAHVRVVNNAKLRAGSNIRSHLLQLLALLMLGMSATANATAGFYGVVLNGVTQSSFALVVVDDSARPYMDYNDFVALGFIKVLPSVVIEGMEVAPLFDHQGLVVNIDAEHLVISLEAEPNWYALTRRDLNAVQPAQPLPAPLGAMLNYGLQVSRSGEAAIAVGSSQSLSLFGSAGLFQLTTAMTSVDTSQTISRNPSGKKLIRLGTTFLRDDVEHLSTLSAGDAMLQAGVGVPSIRYGGITWQSNFGLNPAFSTLDSPTIFDAARLPSTLEFFLNDRRVGTPVAVAPGPFEISGLPTVGTNGTVKVLIRDALNNERMVTMPYLHNANLYRPGLHSFSYTVGLLRPDLDQYDTPFIASSHRFGLTRWLTLNAGATLSGLHNSMGVGATMALLGNVVGDGNLTMSNSQAGSGQKVASSAQWQNGIANFGVSISHASPSFELLGDNVRTQAHLRDDMRLFAGRFLGNNAGSVSLSFGSLSSWAEDTRSISSIGWSGNFRSVNVSLSGVHTKESTLLQLTVNVPMEKRALLSSSVQTQEKGTTARIDYATAPLIGKGTAWRLGMTTNDLANTAEPTSYVAAVAVRSDFGEHGLELDSRQDEQSWRAHTAGSLGVLEGRRFVGPPITGGFALVSTGDAPNIPVYRWNLPVAVSDSQGLALVTTLSPYQKNLLTVKPEDVPLQYHIAKNEMTAIPRGRGGVLVDFSIVRERPALLLFKLPNGYDLPVGANVRVLSTGESAPVGQRGEVYLKNLPEQTEVEVTFKGTTCRVTVLRPPTNDPQPRLGPYVCTLHKVP